MALADKLFITGAYEAGPVITTLIDIFTPEATDAWSRVLCRMGMEDIPLRDSFETEMAIMIKVYHLRTYGAKEFEPAVFPGRTVHNTMLFCFELLQSLLKLIEGVSDYERMSTTFDYYIRVVGTLAPLLPHRAMGFDISAPHAVLFVLESTANSFVYKRQWSSSVQEGGFCKVHAVFMNVLSKRLMEISEPSLEAINDHKTPFGHFAGSNALVCTLKRLDRQFTGLIAHEHRGDHKHTKYLISLKGHCMNIAVENVKRLTDAAKPVWNAMVADVDRSQMKKASTPNDLFCLLDVWDLFKYRLPKYRVHEERAEAFSSSEIHTSGPNATENGAGPSGLAGHKRVATMSAVGRNSDGSEYTYTPLEELDRKIEVERARANKRRPSFDRRRRLEEYLSSTSTASSNDNTPREFLTAEERQRVSEVKGYKELDQGGPVFLSKCDSLVPKLLDDYEAKRFNAIEKILMRLVQTTLKRERERVPLTTLDMTSLILGIGGSKLAKTIQSISRLSTRGDNSLYVRLASYLIWSWNMLIISAMNSPTKVEVLGGIEGEWQTLFAVGAVDVPICSISWEVQEKVRKLRWLLQCAHKEIGRLQEGRSAATVQ